MKPKQRHFFWISLIFCLIAVEASALDVRLRFYIPLSQTISVDGFSDKEVTTTEYNFTYVMPTSSTFDLGIGYTFLSGSVENSAERFDTNDEGVSEQIRLKTEGSFSTHSIELSSIFEPSRGKGGNNLNFTVGIEIMLAGSAEVSAETAVTGQANVKTTESASSVGGFGTLLGIGIRTSKRWEWFAYRRDKTITYDVKVLQIDGSSDDMVLYLEELGVGIGFGF